MLTTGCAVAGPPAVERSATGRSWRWRACDEALALQISQHHGLPDLVGRVLAARGVTPDEVPAFLAPRVGARLPDPSSLLDLDLAADRLAGAVRAGEPVGLIGDYDVDGATSVALLARQLRALGAGVEIEIPDRLRDGYGPNPGAFDRLLERGCRLVLTLDAGTTAFEALAHARSRGQEVVVVDHHVAEARLPDALAVVNPNRLDQPPGAGDLAAVGVTFLLAVGLNRRLRETGWFATRPEPDLRTWLDLVALGTVCDLVPLAGLNRAFVAQGLKVAARGTNPGLAALTRIAGLEGPPSADRFGFWLGPRINAGGRIGPSTLGAELLLSDDLDRVQVIARELERLNSERRRLERLALEAAETAVAPALAADLPVLVVAGAGWSPGVVGLIAARLVERHHRPALAIGLAEGVGKGSGRSVPGFDLGGAVIAARQAGLLLQGGGHPMAAGLTIAAEAVPAFEAFLRDRMAALGPGWRAAARVLELDGAARIAGLDCAKARALAQLAPFGRGHPEPRFVLTDALVGNLREVGEGHLDCRLGEASGGGWLRAIAFRAKGRPLGNALEAAAGGSLRLAGRIKLDSWQGQERVTFHIDDAALG
jgi:single-stranded-DNA-specific exonuclease